MKSPLSIFAIFMLMQLCATTSLAYTVEWAVPPTSYSTIRFYKPGIFEFYTDSTRGLITPQGEVLCSFPRKANRESLDNNITIYSRGPHTLGWYFERERKQVKIQDTGYQVSNTYFTEGTIPVAKTLGGLYGFMDSDGKIVVECQFQKVFHFRDGLALVQDTKGKWKYIRKDWDQTHKPLECGKIIAGKSFVNGNTYVQRPGGKWEKIDLNGKTIQLTGAVQLPEIDNYSENHIHREEKNNDPHLIKKQVFEPNKGNITHFQNDDSLLGYWTMGKLIVPAQFSARVQEVNRGKGTVQEFDGDYVAVHTQFNMHAGLLHKIEGDFESLRADSLLTVSTSQNALSPFTGEFRYPTTLDESKLSVCFVVDNREQFFAAESARFENGKCSFAWNPTSEMIGQEGEYEITYQVYADYGLMLYEQIIPVTVAPTVNATLGEIRALPATSDGLQTVCANVFNPRASKPITATLTVADDSGAEIDHTSITLAPDKKGTLRLRIPVNKKRTVKATTSIGKNVSKSKLLNLTPYKKATPPPAKPRYNTKTKPSPLPLIY